MTQVLSASFQEYLQQVQNFSSHYVPNSIDLMKHFGSNDLSLHAQGSIFYIIDYVKQKILFNNLVTKTFLGHDIKFLAEAGPLYYLKLWHKSDYEVANKKIFPSILDFLLKQSPTEVPNLSFSFNYRIKAKGGNYCTVIQRTTFHVNATNAAPLASINSITDVSHFKEDSKIVFTIEKLDNRFSSDFGAPLLKTTYFPEKLPGIFSKREIEILECIYQGLRSKQIAEKLFISLHTVHNHRKKMLIKTNSTNTAELIGYAIKNNIL